MAGGNWSLPTKDSPYLDVPDEIKDRDIDAGTWLDDNGVQRTPINIPVGLKRWNPTAQRFESWSGSAWGALSSLIEHKVRNSDQLNGQTESFYRNAGNINAGTLALARGGTGRSLSAPGADRIYFWDHSNTQTDFLTAGSGLQISGTTLSIPQGAGSGLDADLLDGQHESVMMRTNVARTATVQHTFNPAGAPFLVGASATGQLVSGLNADQVDGFEASAFLREGTSSGLVEVERGSLNVGGDASPNVNFANVYSKAVVSASGGTTNTMTGDISIGFIKSILTDGGGNVTGVEVMNQEVNGAGGTITIHWSVMGIVA